MHREKQRRLTWIFEPIYAYPLTLPTVPFQEQLGKYAASKGWSMSQAAGIVIEERLNRAEAEDKEERSRSK